ncbi:MAG: sulfite exporter TauE/SafE family protein [Dehalococcoidia bacterium]
MYFHILSFSERHPTRQHEALCRKASAAYNRVVEPLQLAAVFVLAVFASGTQASTGFGFGLLIVPPLVLVAGPKDAVVISNVLATALSAFMTTQLRGAIEWRTGLVLLGAAACGMPIGLAVLILLDPDVLQVLIAVSVLVATAALARGFHVRRAGFWADAVVGLMSGALRTSTSMSGPPVVLYLQGQGLSPDRFRATLTAFFLATGLIAITSFTIGARFNEDIVLAVLAGLPALAVGWLVGNAIFARLNDRVFRRVVMSVLVASSLVAIAGGILG